MPEEEEEELQQGQLPQVAWVVADKEALNLMWELQEPMELEVEVEAEAELFWAGGPVLEMVGLAS